MLEFLSTLRSNAILADSLTHFVPFRGSAFFAPSLGDLGRLTFSSIATLHSRGLGSGLPRCLDLLTLSLLPRQGPLMTPSFGLRHFVLPLPFNMLPLFALFPGASLSTLTVLILFRSSIRSRRLGLTILFSSSLAASSSTYRTSISASFTSPGTSTLWPMPFRAHCCTLQLSVPHACRFSPSSPPFSPRGTHFHPLDARRGMPSDVKALPFVPATPLGAMDGRAFS